MEWPTEEETSGQDTSLVVAQAHGRHNNPPKDHDGGDEDAGLEPFQQDISERLEEGVGYEEDGERGVVVSTSHVQVLLQSVEPCVADIGSIEKTAEVEEAEPRDEFEIEFMKQLFVLLPHKTMSERPNWKVGSNLLTMRSLSASLSPASGSGGRWLWPTVSNSPGATPILFSSRSDGELPLSLSA